VLTSSRELPLTTRSVPEASRSRKKKENLGELLGIDGELTAGLIEILLERGFSTDKAQELVSSICETNENTKIPLSGGEGFYCEEEEDELVGPLFLPPERGLYGEWTQARWC